jgi:hypothetical protein
MIISFITLIEMYIKLFQTDLFQTKKMFKIFTFILFIFISLTQIIPINADHGKYDLKKTTRTNDLMKYGQKTIFKRIVSYKGIHRGILIF